MFISKFIVSRFLVLASAVICAILRFGSPGIAAEKLVGLQSAPSIAMALLWFAEEARLHPKYNLDFQLVYIASFGIDTGMIFPLHQNLKWSLSCRGV